MGSKRDGVVPQSDLARLDQAYVKSLQVGQMVDVVISRQPDDDGIFLLSMSEALQRRDWQLAEELLESGEVTAHQVEGFNKGGLTVQFHRLRGFVPASHVVDMPRNLSEDQRREELESRIGQTLRLKVIEVERRRRRLVMSQSLAEREFQAQRRKELFETIHVGDVIQGEVRSMRPFGAFVDVGGADGLLHVSEIDWRPVNHPRDVLEVGQIVEVQVIRVDPENYRIALSRKRRLPNPWDTVEARYHPGELVPAKITRVVDFGAFAQLEPGVEGLIHISELADIAVAEPLKSVQVGDRVHVKILRVDGNRQRIGLSLRQVLDSELAEIEVEEAVEDIAADVEELAEEAEELAEAEAVVEELEAAVEEEIVAGIEAEEEIAAEVEELAEEAVELAEAEAVVEELEAAVEEEIMAGLEAEEEIAAEVEELAEEAAELAEAKAVIEGAEAEVEEGIAAGLKAGEDVEALVDEAVELAEAEAVIEELEAEVDEEIAARVEAEVEIAAEVEALTEVAEELAEAEAVIEELEAEVDEEIAAGIEAEEEIAAEVEALTEAAEELAEAEAAIEEMEAVVEEEIAAGIEAEVEILEAAAAIEEELDTEEAGDEEDQDDEELAKG